MSTESVEQEVVLARFERGQLKKAISMLQILAIVQLGVIVALAYGMWDTGNRMQSTTGEVNGLRENIQGLFAENVPVIKELTESTEKANQSAAGLKERLEGDFGVETKMNEAMDRMKTEIPNSIERFFDKRGAEIMKQSFDDPVVKDQITQTIKESMQDPEVKKTIEDAVKDAFRAGLTKKK